MSEDALDHGRLLDGRDERPAAVRAMLDVDIAISIGRFSHCAQRMRPVALPVGVCAQSPACAGVGVVNVGTGTTAFRSVAEQSAPVDQCPPIAKGMNLSLYVRFRANSRATSSVAFGRNRNINKLEIILHVFDESANRLRGLCRGRLQQEIRGINLNHFGARV